MHAQSAQIDIAYMTFIDNTAHGDGGGLFASASKISFEGSTFMSNRAQGRGGGVACVDGCKGNFTSCVFTENVATVDGGAVYATDSTFILGANVRSNQAGARGGGLLASNCLIGFAAALFTNNTALGNESRAFASDVFLEKSSQYLNKWVLNVSGQDAMVCDDCPIFCPAANNCTDCDPTNNYCVSMDNQAMCAPTSTCLHGGTCKLVMRTKVTCACGKYRDSADLCREYEFPIIYVYAGLGAIAGIILLTVAIIAVRLQLKKRNQYQILINE
jgi:predicted outer membrane repeat protein